MIFLVACVVAVLTAIVLSVGRFARTPVWRATVTPLASIIGSGFLICGPLLAHDFGSAAIVAMTALLLLAYAVGAVVRFNIIHVENYLADAVFHDPVMWLARATQAVLAVAYAISVAYYLKLLAEFCLRPVAVPAAWAVLASNGLVTVIILILTGLAVQGGLQKVERLAHGTVSLKLAIIAGLLASLGVWWGLHWRATDPLPPAHFPLKNIPVLLGLLITVQGFETSRYLGHAYSQALRVRSMRYAQWIASVIYLAFILLLTPFLQRAANTQGVAGILDIMAFVAAPLAAFVLVGAVASQLSAAVADSIGSGGLMNEVSRRKLKVPVAFGVAGALALAVVWLTDPFQVVAVSSRAFALFYALQCVLALVVGTRTRALGRTQGVGIAVVGFICILAALVGAPAE